MGVQVNDKKTPSNSRLEQFRSHRELVKTVYPLVGLWRICRVCHTPILESCGKMMGYRLTDTHESFTFHVGDCVSIFEQASKEIDRVEGYFCASCLGHRWDRDLP